MTMQLIILASLALCHPPSHPVCEKSLHSDPSRSVSVIQFIASCEVPNGFLITSEEKSRQSFRQRQICDMNFISEIWDLPVSQGAISESEDKDAPQCHLGLMSVYFSSDFISLKTREKWEMYFASQLPFHCHISWYPIQNVLHCPIFGS